MMSLTYPPSFYSFIHENQDVEIGLSTFAKLRPIECRWAGQRGYHEQCTCIIHENFKALLHPILGTTLKIGEVLQKMVCDLESPECMLSLCSRCPTALGITELTMDIDEDDLITYNKWERTDGVVLNTNQATGAQYVQEIENCLPKILQHHFIAKKQTRYIKELKESLKLKPGHCVVQMDFAENYTCVIQSSVQSYHWSPPQVTLHSFCVTFYDTERDKLRDKCYAVVSDRMAHDANAVAAYISYFLRELQSDMTVTHINYVSDGCGGQYKNYKNFVNLMHHFQDHNIRARWHFTATAHGRSKCDSTMGVSKGEARRYSLQGHMIRTPEEMYKFCRDNLTTLDLKFIYVTDEQVREYSDRVNLARRYNTVSTIAGTQSLHTFQPLNDEYIRLKRFSAAAEFKDHRFAKSVTDFQSSTISHADVGDYLVVRINGVTQLGFVTNIQDDGSYVLHFMRKGELHNTFTWPEDDEGHPRVEHEVMENEIVAKVEPPSPAAGLYYKLTPEDARHL